MLSQFTTWLLQLVQEVVGALFGLIKDVLIELLDLVLTAVASLLSLIPVPDFMSQGLGSLFSGLDGGIAWICAQAGLPQALAIIGGGFAFRFARKLVTLFQW